MTDSAALTLHDVHCVLSGQVILDGISLHLPAGEIGCLVGPSGCGKSTLLRAIAGLQPVAEGQIQLGDTVVSRHGFTQDPAQRQMGLVFQDWALFPHLTVAENIAFGLHRQPRATAQARVAHLLTLIGLSDLANRLPQSLSGGQQQRVALARALAPRPKLLLMDEPFSSLDAGLRERLATDVQGWLRSEGITALVVTHDQQEAFALADRMGVLQHGRLLQWDAPYEIYHQPQSRAVAKFIGESVFIDGQIEDARSVRTALGVLDSRTPLPDAPGTTVSVLLRPDDLIHDDEAPLQLTILRRRFRGADYLLELALNAHQTIQALVPSHHDHAVGQAIGIRLAVDHVVTFPSTSS